MCLINIYTFFCELPVDILFLFSPCVLYIFLLIYRHSVYIIYNNFFVSVSKCYILYTHHPIESYKNKSLMLVLLLHLRKQKTKNVKQSAQVTQQKSRNWSPFLSDSKAQDFSGEKGISKVCHKNYSNVKILSNI